MTAGVRSDLLGRWLSFLCTALLLTSSGAARPQETAGEVIVLTVADAISPATMDYLQQGIAEAEESAANLVVIRLDTPGGLMASTRELIKTILASRVPVATWVAPPGSRAASAGTYILLASHIAAMAPSTHLGSATPVQLGAMPGRGKPAPGDDKQDAAGDPVDDTASGGRTRGGAMERKVLEDAVSYLRGLAARHGRNADWAERAVREAANLGARQALEENVIDVLAEDLPQLLSRVDGRRVELASGTMLVNSAEATVREIEAGWRTRLLSVVSNPNIAYFLLLVGFYGIVFELANPGSLLPGVVGATCLLLALFAFQILSVNYAGLALIVFGLALVVAEAFLPSFGVLGAGGLLAFVAGSVILMDGNHGSVSLPLIGGVSLVAGGFLLWLVTRFVGLRRRRPAYGVEHLLEEHAVASEPFSARGDGLFEGHVRMSGERWKARSETPVCAGETLTVVAIQGLTLRVATDPVGRPPPDAPRSISD